MIISCVEGIRSIIINFSPSFFWRKTTNEKKLLQLELEKISI